MAAQKKTNAQRILEREKISYQSYTYDISDGLLDGVSVADKVGQAYNTVFKTLVARGNSKNILVFIIPVDRELDLKAAAKAAGEKSVAMISIKELTPLTGYMKGGCSPVGMKKLFATFIDDSAEALPLMVTSAGAVGYQIELSPQDLKKVTEAVFVPLSFAGNSR